MIPASQPNRSGDIAASNYWQRLHPWCIIRLLPKMQRIVVQRFRYRSQAEDYLKALRRTFPNAIHEIIFDPVSEGFEGDDRSSLQKTVSQRQFDEFFRFVLSGFCPLDPHSRGLQAKISGSKSPNLGDLGGFPNSSPK